MYTKEQLQPLPQIEVSFQDDFSGYEREITLTPHYILRKLDEIGFKVRIGDKILLWEKDVDDKDNEYYLCNVGQIVEATSEIMHEYSGLNISIKELNMLGDKPVIIHILSLIHI